MTTRIQKLTAEKLARLEELERNGSPRPWGDGGEGANDIWQEHPTKKRITFGSRPEDRDFERLKLIANVHGDGPWIDDEPGGVHADLWLICELRNHAKELISLAKIGLAQRQSQSCEH